MTFVFGSVSTGAFKKLSTPVEILFVSLAYKSFPHIHFKTYLDTLVVQKATFSTPLLLFN